MNGSTTFDLPISGMTCASCAGRVERALGKVPGVQSVSVNLANERAHIEVLGQMDPSVLIAAVDKAGYTATLPQSETATQASQEQRLSH
ncbi:MAG: heavy-metal-associated domain-containing protein, partial [Pseudomonas sp.]|nr:heavy-metal-associated domain-containing protein [Pseudomonas sp.]